MTQSYFSLNKSHFRGFLYLREVDDSSSSRTDEQSSESLLGRVAMPDHVSGAGELPLEKVHLHDVIAVPRERGELVFT